MWYLVSYGILFHYGNFSDDTFNEYFLWTNTVMDGGWVHPLAKARPSLVGNLWWNVVMGDWNLDEEPLGKWQ